ncbi:hypothetical protein A3Q56_03426 [Intoshia linei]|uniref:RING-type domain-containing protein n=1 Tax=Intoshia linei TaxID=1819745 RepID=A0A177B3I1_9BILA|nr:hypothetical protein A3Q56_03426 [Intoshia linei]
MGFKDSKTPKTIPFSFGNPNVLITKGLIHYYKDEKDADLSKLENIKTLCMIEIPTTFTIHNLLYFLRCENNHIESVTVLSDSLPESYMVLLTFENVKYMKSFYKKNNTQDLNGFIVAKCQLIFISKIDIYRKSDESQSLLNFVEFPTCPVCLEKWKNDTILRIICNHTFHSNCLRKWKDLT